MPTPMQAAIMGGGAQSAYVDMWFSAGAYRVGGATVGTLGLVSGWSFTAASLRMGFGPTGYLTYGPNNLCLYSQTFDNATWVKAQGGVGSVPVVTADTALAPDGTMTADTVVFTLNGGTASGDISQLQQTINTTSPALFSFWAMTTDGTSKVFTIVGPGGTSATITITGTYQRFYVKDAAGGSSAARLRLRGSASGEGTAASASIYLWGAQLEAVTYATTPSTYYPTTTAAYYGPRLVYDPVTLASLGILVEEARTNVVLWNRDLTNAAWTATNITPVKDQTGIDGVANSASKITATAGNGTILQAITLASSARQQSAYVKRVTGTGVVNMTTDGVTWTAITLTAAWTRVTIPAQAAVVNPVLGFQIMTSGDAIAVDCVQNEAGTGASSAIVTTSAAVTRAADVPLLTGLSVPDGCTVLFEGFAPNFVSSACRSGLSDGTTNNRLFAGYAGTTLSSNEAVAAAPQTLGSATVAASGAAKVAISSGAGAYAGSVNGGAAVTYSGATMPTLTQLDIGDSPSGGQQWNGVWSRARVWKSVKPVQALTT